MWTTKKLRNEFLSYFEKQKHTIMDSSPVVPINDDSLLFTNSGMVQFKRILQGEKTDLSRVCTVQRCIRAGGKHNDLDDVGKDNYHHTFFEMLGNWSFGDYFKEEAIDFAWDFLVNTLGLTKERLYVTYYKELDEESFRIWSKYLPGNRIIPSSFKDNFWEMGETGPCGPCTEIHYDRIGGRDASDLVNKDDPNVLEIWNIVFIEYNRTPEKLEDLDRKCIDTGIGLERLLSILLNVKSNYLIDSFSTIIRSIEENCEYKYGDEDTLTDVAFRVVADHSRTIAACLNDKVDFSNDGVGYVLRRILRRAVRYAHEILQIKPGVLRKLVEIASETIDVKVENIKSVDDEEQLFIKTLKKGTERFEKITKDTQKLCGEDLFLLYDTYGFPVDLTELIAREKNVKIDYKGFEEAKNKAIEISKRTKEKPWSFGADITVDFEKTDDSLKYEKNDITATFQFAIVGDKLVVDADSLPEEKEIAIVYDKTCFYAESGGQVGDKGKIVYKNGVFNVIDTQLIRGYALHVGFLSGKFSNDAILVYDSDIRKDTMKNHSATHIVNHFLRKIIKTEQRGSMVDNDKFRFDFEGKKLLPEQIAELEKNVNDFILSKAPVKPTILDKNEAMEDSSIIHMKNEEYPDSVRVIRMTGETDVLGEMCGGTHVSNTEEIGRMRIISEGSVSANTRRIVGITGKKAEDLDKEVEELTKQLNEKKIVAVGKHLPYLAREKLDKLYKINLKLAAEENKKHFNNCKIELMSLVNEMKLEKMPEKANLKLVYNFSSIESTTKKDVNQAVTQLCSFCQNNEIDSFIYGLIDNECLVSACSKDNSKLIVKLTNEFPEAHFRISNGQVKGIISTLEISDEKFKKIL